MASTGHVLYAKLSVENFKWLTALIKAYKEAVDKVGVGTDEPHAKIKLLKWWKSRIALEVSLKFKTKMKWSLKWFPHETQFEINFKLNFKFKLNMKNCSYSRGHLWNHYVFLVESFKFCAVLTDAIRLLFKDGSLTNLPPRRAVCNKMQTRVILPTNIGKKQHITARNASQLQ